MSDGMPYTGTLAEYRKARRREYLGGYINDVRAVWEKEWRGKDHPYARFSTFLGERILTDFDLRDIEPRP